MKGQAETHLLTLNEEKNGVLDAYLLRPASVLPKETGLEDYSGVGVEQFGVEVLSAAAADLAINGSEEKLFQNTELVKRGKAFLVEKK